MPKNPQEELDAPDPVRCQAMKPNGHSFMTLGGVPGLVRCKTKPIVIAFEVNPGKDGRKGSMSLCGDCMVVAQEQLGYGFLKFGPIKVEKS